MIRAELAACAMALFIFPTAAAMTGVVTPEFRLGTHIRFRCCMVMIVVAIRAMHMGLRWWGLVVGHDANSRRAQ